MRKILVLTLLLLIGLPVYGQLNKRYAHYMGGWSINNRRPEQAINTYNRLIVADNNAYDAYFYRGIAKANLQDNAGAESDFTKAIELNPVYTLAFMYRAMIRTRLGRHDDALADNNSAIEIRPDMADLFYRRGITYLYKKEYDKAVSDFSRFLKHSNRFLEQQTEFGLNMEADAYVLRGDCYMTLGDTLKAYSDFDNAIKANPYYPLGYYYRGSAFANDKEYERALPDLMKSVEIDSTFIGGYFMLADVYDKTQKPVQAIKSLTKALEADSTLAFAYFNRAMVRCNIGDYNNALRDYDMAARYAPENVLIYYNRANLHADLGDYRAAIRDYTRAIELYPDFSSAYLQRAQLKYVMNDMRGSKQDVQTAERKIAEYRNQVAQGILSPSEYADTSRNFNALLSFDVKGDPSVAAEVRAGQKMNSNMAPMYSFDIVERDSVPRLEESYNGIFREFLDRVGAPKLHLSSKNISLPVDSLIALDNNLKERIESGNWEWEVLFLRGVVLSSLNQYSNAINTLSMAIEKEPANGFLYLARSMARAKMIEFVSSMDYSFGSTVPGDNMLNSSSPQYNYDEAIADLNKAAKLLPEFAYVFYNRGRLQVLSGRLEMARDDFSKAITLNSHISEAYFNRGLVELSLGENAKGRMDISKAGELGYRDAYAVLKALRD